jgi:hypothetical protein
MDAVRSSAPEERLLFRHAHTARQFGLPGARNGDPRRDRGLEGRHDEPIEGSARRGSFASPPVTATLALAQP